MKLRATAVGQAQRFAREPVGEIGLSPEPPELICDFAGHCWQDAGGDMMICPVCGAERHDDEQEHKR